MKEFKIITDVNGVERVVDLPPQTNCRVCGCQISMLTAQLHRGACPKCFKETSQLWFDEELISILPINVPLKQSQFGNHFYKITRSQIDALLNGEVLYSLSEYGTFIKLVEEEPK